MISTNLAYALGPSAVGLTVVTTLGLSVGKSLQNAGGVTQILTFGILILLPFLAYRSGGLRNYHPFELTLPALSLFSLNVFGKMSMGAFSGFEYVAILAGECRNPARSIGLSVVIAQMASIWWVPSPKC